MPTNYTLSDSPAGLETLPETWAKADGMPPLFRMTSQSEDQTSGELHERMVLSL